MLPVLAGLALGAVCLVSLRYGERRLYYHDRDRVIAELSAIQGVHVITVDGPDDGWHMTVAYAWFSIGRDPNKTICLQAPKAGDLGSGRHMWIASMGPRRVYVEVDDSRQMMGFLDVGKDSEFAQILPFKLKGVGDLVAHYDEVLAFINREPSGRYITQDGKTCTYHVRVQ